MCFNLIKCVITEQFCGRTSEGTEQILEYSIAYYWSCIIFTLSQAQSIFDYGMKGYHQAAEQKRQDAVHNAAKLAAAATTVAYKEAKMAAKTKQVVLTAGMEATVFNAHLSGEVFREAFDRQFVKSFKAGLEQLLGIENLLEFDKPAEMAPLASVASPVFVAVPLQREVDDGLDTTQAAKPKSPSYNAQQFFQEVVVVAKSSSPQHDCCANGARC